MKIITFYLNGSDELQALTADEFDATYQNLKDFDYEEYVWQEHPTKEAALANHNAAFTAWQGGQNKAGVNIVTRTALTRKENVMKFSFDGHGINDKESEFSERVATFTPAYKNRRDIGNLFEAAPDLLIAIEELIDQLQAIGIPDWHGAEGLCLKQSLSAISKAKGGAA